MNGQSSASWPSPLQERLLLVALGRPDEAVAAWRTLPDDFSLDRLEPGSFELMPLIYRNLMSSGYADPLLPRLKGIYRRSWVKNNLLLERTRDLAAAFREASIPVLFVEGPTLAVRYYPDLGLRPTSSLHMLVHKRDTQRALVQLGHQGWLTRPDSGAYPDWRFLFDGGGNICVLRSALVFDFAASPRRGDAEQVLWEGAERQEVAGTSVMVPAPTDALLSALVSGARLAPLPRTQWVPDAAMILRATNIDWERLLELGRAGAQTRRLQDVLAYLRPLPIPDPPDEVRTRLERACPPHRERLTYILTASSVRGLGGLPQALAEHLVATEDHTWIHTIWTFPGRLSKRWGLRSTWQIPFAVVGKVLKRHMRTGVAP